MLHFANENPDPVAVASLWVAGVSVLLAGASLAWSMTLALRIEKARVRVEIIQGQVYTSGALRSVVQVAATNTGRMPTKVLAIHLAFGKRPWKWRRHAPQRFRRNETLMVLGDIPALSQPLPADLPPGGDVLFITSREGVVDTADREKTNTIYAYVVTTTAGTRRTRRVKIER